MFAQLGSIPFQGLKGFTQFSEARSVNLAEHARIEGKPRLQRVGSNLHELSVSVMLHASFCNPEQEFTALDDAREAATILPLVLANGVYVGDYVIESLQRDVVQADPQSNIVAQVVNLSLKEAYNPNPQQRLSTAARQRAYATSDGGATPLRILKPLPPTRAQSVTADVSLIRLEDVTVNKNVLRAEIATSERPYLSTMIEQSLGVMENASMRIQDRMLDPLLLPFAGNLPTAAGSVQIAVNNLRAVLPITNINDVLPLNSALLSSVEAMGSAACFINNAVITRRI